MSATISTRGAMDLGKAIRELEVEPEPAPVPTPPPLPKALVAGPTVGWRAWVSGQRDVFLRLYSPVAEDQVWPPGRPMMAACRCGIWKRRSHSGAPSPLGSCGIYAAKDRARLDYAGLGEGVILGQVAMWGRVIEHEHGYRAQYAYPVSLEWPAPATVLPPGFPRGGEQERVMRQLGELYGVPVRGGAQGLPEEETR